MVSDMSLSNSGVNMGRQCKAPGPTTSRGLRCPSRFRPKSTPLHPVPHHHASSLNTPLLTTISMQMAGASIWFENEGVVGPGLKTGDRGFGY